MFEIDKKKFGAFVSALRKEKGYTQKALAQKLFISDKAVSKWETGVSFPDPQLLVPLSELLGVTVTELLMCQRMEPKKSIDPGQVEHLVKTAIACSDEKAGRAYQTKSRWPVLYLCSAVAGIAGVFFAHTHQLYGSTLITLTVLGIVFGAYFCLWAKQRLPVFYDENRCGLYADGVFRIHVPGLAFNNSNWPYIVLLGRVWSCLAAALYPLVSIVMNCASPELWIHLELYAALILVFGGLLIPLYVIGKKYE